MNARAATSAPTDPVADSRKHLRWILGALMLTMLLAALDQTIVSTALPTITSDLGGLAELSWVVTAYLLASTASTPIWGKISDLYGRKLMLQIAVAVFVIASMLAGLSQDMGQLLGTRALPDLGLAGLASTGSGAARGLLREVFSDAAIAARRARAI